MEPQLLNVDPEDARHYSGYNEGAEDSSHDQLRNVRQKILPVHEPMKRGRHAQEPREKADVGDLDDQPIAGEHRNGIREPFAPFDIGIDSPEGQVRHSQ